VFPRWLLVLIAIVNALSAVNLTRVFRLVFLGEPQPKTRRAPEVQWPMALPMVTVTAIALLVPLVPQRWQVWFESTGSLGTVSEVLGQGEVLVVLLSGAIGVALGATVTLPRTWVRPVRASYRFAQDLLAYDFYVDRLYYGTVVRAVGTLSRVSDWFDRFVVDGVVNLVGLGTVLGGQSLKYSSSGQSQFYLLTIVLGSALLIALLVNWQF